MRVFRYKISSSTGHFCIGYQVKKRTELIPSAALPFYILETCRVARISRCVWFLFHGDIGAWGLDHDSSRNCMRVGRHSKYLCMCRLKSCGVMLPNQGTAFGLGKRNYSGTVRVVIKLIMERSQWEGAPHRGHAFKGE